MTTAKTNDRGPDDRETTAHKRAKKVGEVIGRLRTEPQVLLRYVDAQRCKRLPTRVTQHAAARPLRLLH